MTFRPPIYGCSTSGMVTVPSACRWFSRKAISIRGGAIPEVLRPYMGGKAVLVPNKK